MKPVRLLIICLLTATTTFTCGCNPECGTYGIFSAEISPQFRQPGDEIMIKTQPIDFLQGKTIYTSDPDQNDEYLSIGTAHYEETMEAWIITLPSTNQISSSREETLYIEDPDCGGHIALNSVTVYGEQFKKMNPGFFATPTPSNIIVPPPTDTCSNTFIKYLV